MSELLLYGHADSGHAHKVALALSLSGLPHQIAVVDIWAPRETRPAAFLAANPFAEVPVLMIDDMALTQSANILIEIALRFGVLGGDDPAQMRRARELLFWEANRIGMCLPQLVAAREGNDPFPAGAVEWLETRYTVDRDRFDKLLGKNDFFHGGVPGIADCAIFGYTQWHDKAKVTASPAMAAWLKRMRGLPGYISAEEAYRAS